MRYANPGAYLATFSGTDTSQEGEIADDIDAVEHWIDRHCERSFDVAASATRVYIPQHTSATLEVDDFTAITSVKFDENADGVFEVTVTGAEGWPLSAAYESRPFTQLHLPSWASRTAFVAGVRVEATLLYGWDEIPQGVVRATVQLTGILRMQSPRATARFDEGIGSFIRSSPEANRIVRELLDPYRMHPVAVA